MKTVMYDTMGSFVVPESPLEIDIIRQMILPDRWDLVSEAPAESVLKLGTLSWRLGGQVVFDPQWSSQVVIHYSIGEHISNGGFNLTVNFHGTPPAGKLGTLKLFAALRIFGLPHDFQCNFSEMARTKFFRPWWRLRANQASASAFGLRIAEGSGPFSVVKTRPTNVVSPDVNIGEILPLHVVLVAPETFNFC